MTVTQMPGKRSLKILFLSVLACWLIAASAAIAETSVSELRLKSVDIFEHMIDFMVTLDLALFAVVGYFCKDGLIRIPKGAGYRLQYGQALFGFFFVIASVISLLFAYLGRAELISQVASTGAFDPDKVSSYICQAFALIASGIFALFFVCITLASKHALRRTVASP